MKFWSTTFDYIVDSDSEPDLVRRNISMYKEYAGNGLTKSEHVGPQQFATVETFSVETNPNTLQKLLDDNIIHIVELGKHQK